MNIDGREVANFILDFCEEIDREISNLALQKVIFFCHVWTLIDYKHPLIKQNFEAWQFGPVLPYLHRQFKQFDRTPIKGRALRINKNSGIKEIVPHHFNEEQKEHLKKILYFYTRLSAGQLVDLSHVRGGPWDQIWNHSGATNPGMKISDVEIARFYSQVQNPFSLQ